MFRKLAFSLALTAIVPYALYARQGMAAFAIAGTPVLYESAATVHQPLATSFHVLAAAQKSAPCHHGLQGIIKAFLAIPYAVMYLLLVVGSILFAVLALIAALLLLIFFAVAWIFLFITSQPLKMAGKLFDASKFCAENSLVVFDLLQKLNLWYSGNCR